jgi:hypothetical protein
MPKVGSTTFVANQPPTLEQRNKQAEQALATRYDALNQHFTQAEQLLKSLKPPHNVWVYYNHGGAEGMGHCESLGMAKYQNKWRLCHKYDYEDEENTAPVPIVECPIEVRIQAAKIVRQLREEIVKAKEDYVPKVDEAIKELADVCNTPLSAREAR